MEEPFTVTQLTNMTMSRPEVVLFRTQTCIGMKTGLIIHTLLLSIILDNKTVLYGKPHDMANLTLSKTTVRENAITFKVEMQECPPGFINNNNQCICSAGSKQFYSPVYTCDHNEFVAIVRHGY